jgi:TonB family protein
MRPASSDKSQLNYSPKSQTTTAHQGFLADCMVDADPSSASRADRARGRAIGISALAQACLLTLVLIVPLLATSRPIAVKNAIPIAPSGGIPRRGQGTKPRATIPINRDPGPMLPSGPQFRLPTNVRVRDEGADDSSRGEFGAPSVPGTRWGSGNDNSVGVGLIPIPGVVEGPQPPIPTGERKPPIKAVAVSEGAELAQLISRVEPVYPRVALYRHTEGTVQLRAIIGRDGTVRELQVISGDAILAFAAREAVKQWRFRPTMLNGRPVEVDTFFTVVFKIKQ